MLSKRLSYLISSDYEKYDYANSYKYLLRSKMQVMLQMMAMIRSENKLYDTIVGIEILYKNYCSMLHYNLFKRKLSNFETSQTNAMIKHI